MDCVLKMKLEFGCGETPTKAGFKTCDIRNLPGIDYVCPAWDIDKQVKENSVDEIFSRHFFEHLTFAQGEKQLEVWHKILKPGGLCEIVLPNLTFHLNQLTNHRNNTKQVRHALAGLWGWQRGVFDDTWDIHKSGYDKDLLTSILEKKGFKNIISLEPITSPHLHIKGIK